MAQIVLRDIGQVLNDIADLLHTPAGIVLASIAGIVLMYRSLYSRGPASIIWGVLCLLLAPLFGYLAWFAQGLPKTDDVVSYRNYSEFFSVAACAGLAYWGVWKGGWRRYLFSKSKDGKEA